MQELNDIGKDAYSKLRAQLELWGEVITGAKDMEINLLAYTIQRHMAKVEYIEKHGDIQEANSGYRQVSPEFTQMVQLHALITKHLKELGFYKDRDGKKNEPQDGFNDLLKKSN